jgi:tetratricopeptide (TPR) repeat protein
MKASILLLCILAGFSDSRANALRTRDWTGVVRTLEPKRGQNIEQDLDLARAYLALERRTEALKVTGSWLRDDRAKALHQIAQTTFFSQETADLYYEGMRWLGLGRFQDAQERFAQAHARESGHVLVLTRLIHSELVLGRKDQAKIRWQEAKALGASSRELRIYGLKLLVGDAFASTEDHRSAVATKSECITEEVPAAFYVEYLIKTGRAPELRGLLRQWLDQKPDWVLPLLRGMNAAGIPEELRKKIKVRLEKHLKDRTLFESRLEREGQRPWSGFLRYEDLVKELAGLTPSGPR